MGTSLSYYLNAPSLGSATAIFTDEELSICAPDGFYSDGVIVREQVDCVLLPQQTCPLCTVPCGDSISASGVQGVYLLDVETGTEVGDVGAIIVRFNPQSVPDGIRATMGTTVYNKLTSFVDGFHQSDISGNLTYVGAVGGDCGISGTTYTGLPVYRYKNNAFVATGDTQTITVSPSDVSLSASAPGNMMMVIPKLTPSPSIINFEVFGPCSSTVWTMNIACPALLTGFSSSVVASSYQDACLLPQNSTYYNASLSNNPGFVGLHDFVFADAYGSVPLAAGFYKATVYILGDFDWFQVDENGVVVALGLCSVAESYNCIDGNCIDPGDGTGTYSTLEECQLNCSEPPSNFVTFLAAYMEPCFGGTIDDYMGVEIRLDQPVTVETNVQIEVTYAVPPNNCSSITNTTSFNLVIPVGDDFAQVAACSAGQYYTDGASISDYCILFCDNPDIDLGSFECGS